MAGSDTEVDSGRTSYSMTLDFEPTPLPAWTLPRSSRTPAVYISGPMSGYVGHNFEAFATAARRVRGMGWEVRSPAEAGVVEGWQWHDYMKRDFDLLSECEAICMLPGWEESEGACIELIAALRMGLTVHSLVGDGLQGERKLSGNLGWDEGEEAEALAKQASGA